MTPFSQRPRLQILATFLLLPLVTFETERLSADNVGAGEGRAPVLFNMIDDQIGSSEVIDSRRAFGIVHRVGHVAHQGDIFSELYHLANAKGSSENAHVEVHAAENDILDTSFFQEIPGFLSVVGEGVSFDQFNGLDLSGPGFANLALFAFATATHIGVVDW